MRSKNISRTRPARCLRLAVRASARRVRELGQAADRAGLAYGLTGLMRALPVHAAGGRVYLPADMLVSRGTGPDAVLAGSASQGLRDLLAALREKARAACAGRAPARGRA